MLASNELCPNYKTRPALRAGPAFGVTWRGPEPACGCG